MKMHRLNAAVLLTLSLFTLSACSGTAGQENPDGIVLPEGFKDGIAYDKNDVKITIADYTEDDTLNVLTCEMTNNGTEEIELSMLPLLINGEVTADGYIYTLKPSETQRNDFFIDTDVLTFAGLKEIKTIDTWVKISKGEEKEETEPELIRLVQKDPDHGAPVLQHSQDVLFDQDGVKMSYLGSLASKYEGNKAVYLVSNDTAGTINADTDYDYQMVDGVYKDGKEIISFSQKTPAGKKSLVTVSVVDNQDYSDVSFESADTRFLFRDENYQELGAVPIHLTVDGTNILSEPGDSYYEDFYRTAYDVFRYPDHDVLEEYVTFFYIKGPGTLQGSIDEIIIPKSTGATREQFESFSLDEAIPGFDSLDFKEVTIEEDDETIRMIIILRNLDDGMNLNQLAKTGYLIGNINNDFQPMSVFPLFKAFEEQNITKLTPEEYESLGLHIDAY